MHLGSSSRPLHSLAAAPPNAATRPSLEFTRFIRSIKWGLDENGRRLKGKGINETLHNLWGMWYKNPTSHDIAFAEKDARQREEQRQHEDDSIRQTPRRRRRREEATQNQRKQATKMYKRAKSADGGEFEVGDVVQVPLADVDRTKVDSSHITAVIVEVGKHDLYRVACKYGQLKSMYAYHRLKRVTGVSNNPSIHGLDDVLVSWRGSCPNYGERGCKAYVECRGARCIQMWLQRCL
jgi:hypothetical protein